MEHINIMEIIARTLSMMDVRLIDHGKNVAILTYRAMKTAGIYSEREIHGMCMLALLHDIGAFRTDDVNALISFDAENAWEHSIYGYLFMKHFSPIARLAPVVLFHHTSRRFMDGIPKHYCALAQIMHIADRLELAARFGNKRMNKFLRRRVHNKNVYSPDIHSLFLENAEFTDRDDIWRDLCAVPQSREDSSSYLNMLVLAIDFRSRHTVNHTVATSEMSRMLAALFRLDPQETQDISIGALLHDLGKSGVPVHILENPGQLQEREMEIMRSHILLTGQILHGHVSEAIEKIACRHHEKLDGSGYPDGLVARELSLAERLVAVADILSALSGARSYKGVFPKDKVIDIMTGMAAKGELDRRIVRKITENYDDLLRKTLIAVRPITAEYERLAQEYADLLGRIKTGYKTGGLYLEELLENSIPAAS